jgi:four helix bundle protein
MREIGNSSRFEVQEKAIQAAAIAIKLAMSVPANLAEGNGRSGRDRLHHFRIALASAREVDTHLRLLIGAGAVVGSRADTALQLFDDVRAMIWRLLHPGPCRPHGRSGRLDGLCVDR